MPATHRPLHVVQLAPDGRRHEVINKDTLELYGAPFYEKEKAQQLAGELNGAEPHAG